MRISSVFGRLLSDWPVKILSLVAAVLIFVFNRMNNLEERIFTVPLEVILPEGYVIAQPLRDQVALTVRGEEQGDILAASADEFRANIDLTDHDREGNFLVPVRYSRKDGIIQAGTFIERVEPPEVTVSLERVAEKTLPVTARIVDGPEVGYSLSQFSVSPSLVRLRGPRGRVEAMTAVTTEEISLSGITGDYKSRVNLVQQDPLVSLGFTHVEFYGIISRTVVTRELRDVPIVLVNADPRYTWEFRPQYGGMRVRGAELDLSGPVVPLRMVVDAARFEAGEQVRAIPVPDVPPEVTVLEFFPREVVVVSQGRVRS